MKEIVLKGFFEGRIDVALLERDMEGTLDQSGNVSRFRIEDMDEEFELRKEHLIRLCDAVLDADFNPRHLEAIGFCLVASDSFVWDTGFAGNKLSAD